MSDIIIYGLVVHLVADWVFQNDWMARHKGSLKHPAAWIHGGIHFAAMRIVFDPHVALMVAALHILIDTRIPVQWWQRVYRQTTDGVYAVPVAIWLDQVLHVIVIVFAAWLRQVG